MDDKDHFDNQMISDMKDRHAAAITEARRIIIELCQVIEDNDILIHKNGASLNHDISNWLKSHPADTGEKCPWCDHIGTTVMPNGERLCNNCNRTVEHLPPTEDTGDLICHKGISHSCSSCNEINCPARDGTGHLPPKEPE